MIQDIFDKIFCINLVEDVERRKYMQKQFSTLNISPVFISANRPVSSYTASNYKLSGELGCTLSHLKALIYSKEYLKPVIILEDDLAFSNNINTILIQVMNNLPEDWSIIYLGGQPKSKLTTYNEYLCKTGKFSTTSGYIINLKYLQELIDYILDNFSTPYPDACTDNLINNYTILKNNGYCIYPPVVEQVDGWSTLRKGYRQYSRRFSERWKKYAP